MHAHTRTREDRSEIDQAIWSIIYPRITQLINQSDPDINKEELIDDFFKTSGFKSQRIELVERRTGKISLSIPFNPKTQTVRLIDLENKPILSYPAKTIKELQLEMNPVKTQKKKTEKLAAIDSMKAFEKAFDHNLFVTWDYILKNMGVRAGSVERFTYYGSLDPEFQLYAKIDPTALNSSLHSFMNIDDWKSMMVETNSIKKTDIKKRLQNRLRAWVTNAIKWSKKNPDSNNDNEYITCEKH